MGTTVLFFLALVLVILGFALYGFVKFVTRFERDDSKMVRSAFRIIDRLYIEDQITHKQFGELRWKIQKTHPYVDVPEISPAALVKWQARPPASTEATAATETDGSQRLSHTEVRPRDPVLHEPIAPTAAARSDSSALPPVASPPGSSAAGAPERSGKKPVPSPAPVMAAPADTFDAFPAAPSKPRRSWSDLLSGFMQENNIRWGELASGILIVGSAVGLVVSLREELRETIPYFPALLFMLITAAVNAAGVYTLRRWKLRNTSRGVLVIGLLLVPLNFLAACVLTNERRSVDDPIYWLAIVVGLTGFSYITWVTSKCLLRFRHWPLFVGTMGPSIGLLLTNRFETVSGSWQTWLLGCLPLVTFAIGSTTAAPRSLSKSKWLPKSINRLWICVGIGAFAFLTALSLILIRSTEPLRAVITMSPLWGAAGAVVCWCGLLVAQGYTSQSSQAPRIAGTSIAVLGLLIALAANLSSILIPSVLVATSLLTGVVLLLGSLNRKLPQALPVAWSCLALSSIAALYLVLGEVTWDRWASPWKLFDLATNAKCGLWMMVLGSTILTAQALLSRRFSGNSLVIVGDRWNRISGGLIAAAGCIVSVGASFVHPDRQFDNYAATVMLSIAATYLLFVSTYRKDERYTTGAVVGTLACLGHGLLWNQFVMDQVHATLGANCSAVLLLVSSGFAFGLCSLFRARSLGCDTARLLALSSAVASGIGLVGAAALVPLESGLASGFSVAVCVSALLMAYGQRSTVASSWLVTVSSVMASIFVAEFCLARGVVAELWSVRHISIQLAVLSLWNAEWLGVTSICRQPRSPFVSSLHGWLTKDGGWLAQRSCELLVVATVVFLLWGIVPEVAAELVANFNPSAMGLAYRGEIPAVGTALLCVVFMAVAGQVVQPRHFLTQGILLLWLLAWSLGSFQFADARAMATANRWLLPVGGALAAIAIGRRDLWWSRWSQTRGWLGGVDNEVSADIGRAVDESANKSAWTDKQAQRLINVGLFVVVGVVLAITTVAISRFMVLGGESLGGPLRPSLFGNLRKDVSYGIPIGILVSTFLFYAVTERRSWLAVAGSLVYQYVVLVAVVLLFISPHPKLASEWFLHVMQAVSGGMSAYGLVWFFFRERIGTKPISERTSWTQLDIHTTINCVLVVSLATLIIQRFFFHPTISADWINEAGGKFGVVAFVAVAGLVFTVWRQRIGSYKYCLVGAMGLTLAAFVASLVDRLGVGPWWGFRVIAFGAVATGVVQTAMLCRIRFTELSVEHLSNVVWGRDTTAISRGNPLVFLPLQICLGLALAFAARGFSGDQFDFAYLLATGLVVASIIAYGLIAESAWAAWFAAFANIFLVWQVCEFNLWAKSEEDVVGQQLIGFMAIALTWILFSIRRHKLGRSIRRSFQTYPLVVLLCAGLLGLVLGLADQLSTWWWIALAMTVALASTAFWNARGGWRVFAPYVVSIGFALALLHRITSNPRASWLLFLVAVVVATWGYVFAKRTILRGWANNAGMLRVAALQRVWLRQLPMLQTVTAGVVVIGCLSVLSSNDIRLDRYLVASVPLLFGVGMIPLACQPTKHHYYLAFARLQHRRRGLSTSASNTAQTVFPSPNHQPWVLSVLPATAVAMLILGGCFLALADLPTAEMLFSSLRLLSRITIALSLCVFLCGWWVPNRISEQSPWLSVVRSSTVATAVLAIVSFAILLSMQQQQFQHGLGSGLAIGPSAAVCVVVLGMIAALLAVAVLPKHDPLSLSVTQRQAYVYVAQLVTAMLGIHIYLSMPWLFEFGILKYWPYLAMLLAFGGVGVAHLLSKRELQVLAQPIFNTGVLVPIVTAAGFWAVDSRADAALVMLLAGLLYLAVTIVNQSSWSAVAAVLFGNFALWLFYDKFPGLAFLTHPQLWLIPPAVSVLVAAQLNKHRLSKSQLAMARYVSLFVIYLSSTSEIFISGLGQQLLPPMILAVLAVMGILAGMMFQVRAFLYLGSVFLLLAMITMVAHAQQRLDHVWPWWAFGLTMGTAILVMFGLFEKRRADMQAVVGKLQDWES